MVIRQLLEIGTPKKFNRFRMVENDVIQEVLYSQNIAKSTQRRVQLISYIACGILLEKICWLYARNR